MFVGFIAVVVILLVIVGLMSSGATSGSGGVDQTKATKVLGELSGLAQSAGFYKTTTVGSNYAGLTVGQLVANGIVSVDDTIKVDGTPATGAGDAAHIVSKSVPELVYTVAVDGARTNRLVVTPLMHPDADLATIGLQPAVITASLGGALEAAYAKLVPEANVFATGTFDPAVTTTGSHVDKGTVITDGLASIYLEQ